jgi:uncharacterized protein with PIN domain
MGRIRDAYETKYRALLSQVRPRRLELGVQLLLDRAERLSHRPGMDLPHALASVYERARRQIERRLSAGRPDTPAAPGMMAANSIPVFVCDAGLGGLARWLRAAGYEAHWRPDIDDDELIREARLLPATLLTTDSLLMERGVLRDGFIPGLWIPPFLKKFEQLVMVLHELSIPVRESRCMSCGGELRRVPKDAVRDRIPPKTYRWLEDYFVCSACDKLFWRGTHWQRIGQRLDALTNSRASR